MSPARGTRAIIPVAGVGSRLRPHTHTVPKALIHVAQEKRGVQDSTVVDRRAGWRFGARQVIAAVLTDYCASM